jgi:site-specific recombinase XerD
MRSLVGQQGYVRSTCNFSLPGLRHACGFYLANKGVDTRTLQQYLGHRNIQNTIPYTELTAQRFQNFWED